MSGALLELRDLTVRYPLRAPGMGRGRLATAVDRVSFRLERGESLGLVGESGCGKSTLARALMGLVEPSSGEILLDGVDLAKARGAELRAARRRMSLLPQDPFASLDPRCTALDSVVEPLAIHGHLRPRERRLRALVLLEAVGLDPAQAARLPHEFSGGQRQRIALARALALEPEVVLLDEPTSALDVSVQAQVIALLAELQQRFGLAYLFISHDLALVRHLCPRVAVMYFGRIVETSDRDGLFADPRHPYTRALLACAPRADPEVDRHRPPALLHGEPPSHLAPPAGCAFHPRCPDRQRVADDRCAREAPALQADDDAPSRSKACFLEGPPRPTPESEPSPRPVRRPGAIDA